VVVEAGLMKDSLLTRSWIDVRMFCYLEAE